MTIANSGTRINKWLSESGCCSRRAADRLISEGQVTIDERAADPGDRVRDGSIVAINGKPVNARHKKVYIALNKPAGVVCTANKSEPQNIIDYVGYPERIYPVGRLDKESRGLILLTNDGDMAYKITRTAIGVEKEYIVTVDKPLTPDFLRAIAAGVEIIGGKTTMPCKTAKLNAHVFALTLVQGLNRQVRRMCEGQGYRVRDLVRVRVADIQLGTLEPGKWRHLTPGEVSGLNAI
jgi:23S rRNA pseudouridine2604 synthase